MDRRSAIVVWIGTIFIIITVYLAGYYHGRTMGDFADFLGVPITLISRFERGEVTMLPRETEEIDTDEKEETKVSP